MQAAGRRSVGGRHTTQLRRADQLPACTRTHPHPPTSGELLFRWRGAGAVQQASGAARALLRCRSEGGADSEGGCCGCWPFLARCGRVPARRRRDGADEGVRRGTGAASLPWRCRPWRHQPAHHTPPLLLCTAGQAGSAGRHRAGHRGGGAAGTAGSPAVPARSLRPPGAGHPADGEAEEVCAGAPDSCVAGCSGAWPLDCVSGCLAHVVGVAARRSSHPRHRRGPTSHLPAARWACRRWCAWAALKTRGRSLRCARGEGGQGGCVWRHWHPLPAVASLPPPPCQRPALAHHLSASPLLPGPGCAVEPSPAGAG